MKHYSPPKPSPLPEDYEEFYATMTDAEKELDLLAKEMLGSSYFIQWTHMYLKWSKANADKANADKANADKANADKANADKANADKANADKLKAEIKKTEEEKKE